MNLVHVHIFVESAHVFHFIHTEKKSSRTYKLLACGDTVGMLGKLETPHRLHQGKAQ